MSITYIKLKVIAWSVGPSVCRSVGPSQLKVFLYNLYTMSRIETNISVRVDMNDGKIFLEGQGHWVKGQGQIRDLLSISSAYTLHSVGCIGTKLNTYVKNHIVYKQ